MRLLAGLAALLLVMPAAATAEERITNFDSAIRILPDSSLDVTETIEVDAENIAINHGIFRDFPIRYRGQHGEAVKVDFQFLDATLDGAAVASSVTGEGGSVRIRLGDADKLLPIGLHRYTIHYRATRMIGRFRDFDELYWNVTGNRWAFPIEQAAVQISLPHPAKFGQRAVYTGPAGSTATNAEVAAENPGGIRFQTTQPLAPYEGLTVAVAFPKGVVSDPSQADRLRWWLQDYLGFLVGALGFLGTVGFAWYAWRTVGRDPRAGTVVPLFSPPDELSPAAMRYVRKMGVDDRAFAAALVDLGVRGHVRIVEEDGGWFRKNTSRIVRVESANALPEEEATMLNGLGLLPTETIIMRQSEHERFAAAKSALEAPLKARFDGKLFKRNLSWIGALGAVFMAALFVTALAVGFAYGASPRFALLALAASALFLVGVVWLRSSKGCAATALTVFAGLVAAGAAAPVAVAGIQLGGAMPLFIPLLALPAVIATAVTMAAPTAEGRKVLDHIAGFKQYLSIAEGERLDRMTGAPADTVEIFEKFLPYAIALGVENRWADRFRSLLAAASASQSGQQFAWYAGSSSPWENPGGFVSDVGSSLSSTLGSASTAPGSGGGGYSGGGGGGGGGGGW